ncbi:MAG: GNAT family N-acetyltransferase [Deltaproteobacteria bacterium]|nr:GNAT family N-acetyltransferase [Deltaproteobacteria bacterium]
MTTFEYRALRETELSAAARSVSLSFGSSPEDCTGWLESAGLDNVRVLSADGVLCAFLLRIKMGQHLRGRAVSMLGVAGVSVPPEQRGQGYAKVLMEHCVRECHEDTLALSTLYASTQPLYRAVGYEQALHHCEHRFSRGDLAGKRHSEGQERFETRTVTVDNPAVRALSERMAQRTNGSLARGPYIWARIAGHRGVQAEGLGIFRGQSLVGYVFVAQRPSKSGGMWQELIVRDHAYEDEASARGVLALIDRFTTMSDTVIMHGGSSVPLLTLLDQQRWDSKRIEYAMTRVTHVQRALEDAGYARAVSASLTLDVQDALVPGNHGVWSLRVSQGTATVQRGAAEGASVLALDVRWLAPLVLGFASASTLASLGGLRGDSDALALADGVFASPSPSLADFF